MSDIDLHADRDSSFVVTGIIKTVSSLTAVPKPRNDTDERMKYSAGCTGSWCSFSNNNTR